jgi:hypothetical protein
MRFGFLHLNDKAYTIGFIAGCALSGSIVGLL